MNFDKEKKGKRNLGKITVIFPIVISVLSFVFGVYQYFDKRDLEEDKMNLQKVNVELDKQIKELQRREKLMMNQADINIQYLETDLKGILGAHPKSINFEKACLAWLSYLEEILPFDLELTMLESIVYKEIIKYRGDIQDHHISFFLIRNAGGSKATNISTTFTRRNNGKLEAYPIRIDQLDPRTGVIFPIDHFNKKTQEYYGTVLLPGYELEYIDEFLIQNKRMSIRPKLAITRIVGAGTRIMK
ncbi:MAG: hypothetical protein ACFFDT_34875 [Candidatus Hodarchaeota archaeon]